ncbi:MAG TPA: transcriptional repressor [bacterium]|nr:transcriptional repressor [bacterium]
MPEPRHSRKTRQREAVLAELRKAKDHPTADQLYERVRKAIPRISLGTVYRNLELLAAVGAIRVVGSPGGRRYDGEMASHHHVRCTGCGRLDDVHMDVGLEMPRSARFSHNYELTGYQVEFLGLCPACVKNFSRPGRKT